MSSDLNFQLAYERVRDELREVPKTGRALASNPFELELIELDLDSWLRDLGSEVADGSYLPGPIQICNAPKAGDLVRPGVRLSIGDRVVYTAAVGACLNQIDGATRWSQGNHDFATRLDPSRLDQRRWLRNPFKGWEEWHDRSLQRLDSGSVEWVLTADIAGYFENIDLAHLISDLARIECPKEAIGLISRCLNAWAQCPGRGIPQGVMASDILAKLYLEPIDQRVKTHSFRHYRYTDDFRLFTKTREEAQRALVMLSSLLRERGLTLQSKKTQIRPAADAREEFDGIIPAIERVRSGYFDQVIAAGLMAADVSLPMAQVDDLAGGSYAPAVLHQAFETYVIAQPHPNKSMVNFLLRRLGSQKDPFAITECERRLDTHPEHTPSIIRYFEELETPAEIDAVILATLLHETSAIYPYQRYLLLEWLARNARTLSSPLLDVVRELAIRPESADYVRAVAFQLLGKFGTHSDLEEIETRFKSASDPLARAQFLCCLQGLEKSRRNSLAGRINKDNSWVGRAASIVRS